VWTVAIVRLPADEVRRIVDAARSDILRHLRIGTDRTHAGNHAIGHPGSDDILGGDALLDPLLKRGQRIKFIGSSGRGSTTMSDIGREKQSNEFLGFFASRRL
jgi:hypothetical protein